MAEPRRVQITTLTRDAPEIPEAPESAPAAEGPRPRHTVRFVLTLFEPDDRKCPEFNYGQLMEDEVGPAVPRGNLASHPAKDYDWRESEELAAAARRMEEKYGNKAGRKKDRVQDLIDIGFGYDEDDSFIDNSEAYDEFVPSSISTKFGGFYVNAGVLQFRGASDADSDGLAAEEPVKRRKLNGQEKPKKKRSGEGGEAGNGVESQLSADDEIVTKKKKKRKSVTLSVTSMLRKFHREKELERQKILEANQRHAALLATPAACPADAAGGGGSGLADPLLSLIGSTNDQALIQAASTADFDIDLESLLDVGEEPLSPKTQPAAEATAANQPTGQEQPPSRRNSQPPEVQNTSAPGCQLLPGGLPPALEGSIRKLMTVAKTSEGESKLKFFTPEINSALLDIEFQCREQGGPLRSKVFTHLSSFLPCSKDTLLKRVRKLLLAHAEPPDADDPIQELRVAIERAMPEQVAHFQEASQAYEQTKSSRAVDDCGDCRQKVNPGPEDGAEEKAGKRGGGPRKAFKWNSEIRESLCRALRAKMAGCEKDGKGSREAEEHLKTWLETEVKSLWPKGWMQSRVLIRESRKMLGLFTSLLVKRPRSEKKAPPVGESPGEASGRGLHAPPAAEAPLEAENPGSDFSAVLPPSGGSRDFVPSKKEGKPETAPARPGSPSPPSALGDGAQAPEQPFYFSQQLLAAASVAKYKHSLLQWSDAMSPPLPPPPPPQSSPVSLPEIRGCRVVLPQLLAGPGPSGDAHIVSNDGGGEDLVTH